MNEVYKLFPSFPGGDSPPCSDTSLGRCRLSMSAETVFWAIGGQTSFEAIKAFFESSDKEAVRDALRDTVCGFVPMFKAILRNDLRIVNLLCEYGSDLSARDPDLNMPLLAFSIIAAQFDIPDTTDLTVMLLKHGANPLLIPQDMWEDFTAAPKTVAPVEAVVNKASAWCTEKLRITLAKNLHLTHRYNLAKAHSKTIPSPRMVQIATAFEMIHLLELPYHIIGQRSAALEICSIMTRHYLLSKPGPLPIVFAGPHGHGKRTLAAQAAKLLSTEPLFLGCITYEQAGDLYKSELPSTSLEWNSRLNDYLCRQDGRRSIVFLDHFDKATRPIQAMFLNMIQTGRYTNYHNHKNVVDCSKCIWILSTTKGSKALIEFYRNHMSVETNMKAETSISRPYWDQFHRSLKMELAETFEKPFHPFIDNIVPFFPFLPSEAAVLAHKFIRKLCERVREPIDVKAGKFIGHVRLTLKNEMQVCNHIAWWGYHNLDDRDDGKGWGMGAWGMLHLVQSSVAECLIQNYLCSFRNTITDPKRDEEPMHFYIQARKINADGHDKRDQIVVYESFGPGSTNGISSRQGWV